MTRRPKHWEDTAPNDSVKQEARQVPSVAWWVFALIAMLVLAGAGSALLYL